MGSTTDTITSIRNNDGDLTNSRLRLQFPLTRRKLCMDNKRKPPVLVILCCLAKLWLTHSPSPLTLSLRVLSALYCSVYWSPKTVPWLPAKYICYYGNRVQTGELEEKQRTVENMADMTLRLSNGVCGGVLVVQWTVMFSTKQSKHLIIL